MRSALYQLGVFSDKLAAFGYVPVIVLTIYVLTRRETIDVVDFVQTDWVSLLTLFASVIVAVLAALWWEECGHGIWDGCLGFAGIVPCLLNFEMLDPSGVAPIVPW